MSHLPQFAVSVGQDVVDFAAASGLFLDDWQQDILRGSMGLRPSGTWAARHVGLLVPRQNGKGSILEARELYGMFASTEKLIIHSAHKYDTSQKHFARVLALIEGNHDLDRHIKRLSRVSGKESVELRDGTLLQFKARTVSGSARGFTGDLVILDEAMYLPEEAVDAMLPTASAVPNPQTWVTSSAGNKSSGFLWRVVHRGRSGHPSMAYFEWGTPVGVDVSDRRVWAAANPALGVDRANAVQLEALEDDFDLMSLEGFAREHLGVWDDPSGVVISSDAWHARAGAKGAPDGPVAFAVSASWPNADRGYIAVGGRLDGEMVVQIVDSRPGTSWLPGRVRELQERHRPVAVVLDDKDPAAREKAALERAGVELTSVNTTQAGQAAGMFLAAVAGDAPYLRHFSQPELDGAVAGATKRPLGDAWTWARQGPVDIASLVGATFALWGVASHEQAPFFASWR